MIYGIIRKIDIRVSLIYISRGDDDGFTIIKIFQAVAKLGSISKAAKELNYAQSNLTSKIQQLETSLQTTLFYRHNKGVTLTDKGEILLSYTEEIFQLLNEVREVINDDQAPKGP